MAPGHCGGSLPVGTPVTDSRPPGRALRSLTVSSPSTGIMCRRLGWMPGSGSSTGGRRTSTTRNSPRSTPACSRSCPATPTADERTPRICWSSCTVVADTDSHDLWRALRTCGAALTGATAPGRCRRLLVSLWGSLRSLHGSRPATWGPLYASSGSSRGVAVTVTCGSGGRTAAPVAGTRRARCRMARTWRWAVAAATGRSAVALPPQAILSTPITRICRCILTSLIGWRVLRG